MDMRSSIEDTRKGFEESFASGEFYNRQTQDSDHMEKILRFVKIRGKMRVLDLGCGSGYLSFPMAKNNLDSEVIGLDIVSDTLEANRSKANEERIKNLSFVRYDGIDFPFEDQSFDLVVTRYALHHFPDIEHSIGEMSRVLKEGGTLFISDPCPNECDTKRFVDDYMRLKKDGHIRFYSKDEWISLCGKRDLNFVDGFESSIRFPKKKDTAYGYKEKYDAFNAFHSVATEGNQEIIEEAVNESPMEALDAAFKQVNATLASELMDEVMKLTPTEFEKLVVKLLLQMGYGSGIDGAGVVTQRSNDGGIDGIIKEDQLGFSSIYIQAKQWAVDQTVGKPEIQKFVGALTGQQAQKGLFITTAKFSSGALQYASNLLGTKVVLVDGTALTRLMIKHNVGVSVEHTYEVKRLDSDFFADEL